MSKFYVSGLPIEVVAADSLTPLSFTWRKRQHPTDHIEDFWIVQFGWWREESYVSREYFLLTTHTRLLVEIYRSRIDGGWYLQRRYD